MTVSLKSAKAKRTGSIPQSVAGADASTSSLEGNTTFDYSQMAESLYEQQELVMFLGIILDKDQPSLPLSMEYAEVTLTEKSEHESEKDVVIESANFHLKNVCLGHGAKAGETNILEVEVLGKDGKKERYAIANLSVGSLVMSSLDIELDVTTKATIHLAQGSGPVHITGQQEFVYDFDTSYEGEENLSEADEDSEDSEGSDGDMDYKLEEEKPKLEIKSKKSSPSKPLKRKKSAENFGKKKMKVIKQEAEDSEGSPMSAEEPSDELVESEEEEVPPPQPKRKGRTLNPATSGAKQTKADAKKRHQGGKK